MAYILLDESGDLGFKFERGSSNFFLVTTIFTSTKRPLERIVHDVHAGLRKKYRQTGVLHAHRERPATRRRVLERINATDCAILSIVLNKQRVYTKLRDEKPVLYNYVTNILLDRVFRNPPFALAGQVMLIASQRETNKFLNENFRGYLKRQALDSHGITLTVQIAPPSKEKALQVVDFVSWAIFRKYERRDPSFADLVKDRIVGESWIFPEQ